LKEWIRTLEHGGTITIKTPNINTLALAYVHGQIDGSEFARKMYGNGTLIESSSPQDFHYYGYDTSTILQVLKEAGLTEINIRPSGDGGDYPNMIVQARKPSPTK
jgi:predicted SAM-dependent methyltransferase